jgi:hypothetical protein
LIKYLTICCSKICQTITKINIILFNISWSYSFILWIFLIVLIFIISFVSTLLIITKYNIVDSNIFSSNSFLFSFYIIIWVFIFKLWFICSIINIILISNTEIIFSCIIIWLLKSWKFILRIFGRVFRLLIFYFYCNKILC